MKSEAADMAGLRGDAGAGVGATAMPTRRSGRPAGGRGFGQKHGRLYAALDLGTNNCRLLIARPRPGGFTIVDAYSRVVRLGERLGETGVLGEDAQQRAVAALGVCADKIRRRGVHALRAVATEACRQAANGGGFIDRVYAETGLALDVIAPAEEARLAVLGCQLLLDPAGGPGLVFDIGGGSTELVLVDPKATGVQAIRSWASAPWGVVSLAETERNDYRDLADLNAAYARMKARFVDALASLRDELAAGVRQGGCQLLGTSGTVTTLASVYLGLPAYDRRHVDGCVVPVASMRAIGDSLARRSVAERAQLPCIGPERADLVVAGCAILEAIMDYWPAQSIRVADRGIREGVLRALMTRDGFRL